MKAFSLAFCWGFITLGSALHFPLPRRFLDGGAPPEPEIGTTVCQRFQIVKKHDTVDSVAAKFGQDHSGLQLLNPSLDLDLKLEVGTPLCVVGRADYKGAATGKRLETTITYTTSAIDTCLSIATHASPYLGLMALMEMNPLLDCSELPLKAVTIFLPGGTTIGEKETQSLQDQDCVLGPWGDWTDCANGKKHRYRSVYQEQIGKGSACPTASFEAKECNSDRALEEDHRKLLLSYQCPAGYNGCSVPSGLQYYHLFVPACNDHDICYNCNEHPAYVSFATKSYCDRMFLQKMQGQCYSYWSKWWQIFDLTYCLSAASAYYTGVSAFGSSYSTGENSPNGLWADGCYWKPFDPELNNSRNNGFNPSAAGCACLGTSCQYY